MGKIASCGFHGEEVTFQRVNAYIRSTNPASFNNLSSIPIYNAQKFVND